MMLLSKNTMRVLGPNALRDFASREVKDEQEKI